MKQELTVGQLARAAGVTVRTLHHYDRLGLLRPAFIGDNGYRYYGRAELLRLQRIMLYREMGLALADIQTALASEGEDHLSVLADHRERIAAEARRYRDLLATIDRTIRELKGETHMKPEDLYKGFSKEKQAEYEDWLIDAYGGDMEQQIADSRRAYEKLSAAERDEKMRELAAIEGALVSAMQDGFAPVSAEAQALIARHREWVGAMQARRPDPAVYSGLADLYLSHPDFRKRYETLGEGFAEWLAAAMKAHAAAED